MSTELWQVWEETVGRSPGATALIDARTGLTFSRNDLLQEAEKLAARSPAVDRNIVALADPNGAGWFPAFLAIQRAGACALLLDAGIPRERRGAAARELGAGFLWDSGEMVPLETTTEETSTLASDVCLLKVTSGTTGTPRTLPFTSAQMLADGRQVCAGMGIGVEDTNFGAIPFGHSYGLGNLVIPLLTQGTRVAFSAETLPTPLAAEIARVGATVFPTVPAVLRGLAKSTGVEPEDLSSLRLVISAGAFLRGDVATGFYDKFTTCPHGFYGSTETGGICYDADGVSTLDGVSVGKPLPSVRVELDVSTGARVRVTSPAVTSPGTHLLADRGEWNREGELCLRGRAGEVANVGGRKVDPADIERFLRTLPGIADAWVSIRTRDSGDDYLVAAAETHLPREAVMAQLAAGLPPWQVPRQLLTVTLLPRTTRGKLDRSALETRFG